MNANRLIRALLTACVIAGASCCAFATSKSTDISDLWWDPTESGWNITLIQDHNTVYAILFIYGPDNQPNWYTALLAYQGSLAWSGTLYRTTGPWFGALPFEPNNVAIAPVGNLSVTFAAINLVNLTYTINGLAVTKAVQRFTLANEDFRGNFAAVMSEQGIGIPCNPVDNVTAASATVQITQAGSAMTVVTMAGGNTCTFPGFYNQSGHFGHLAGSYTCTSGTSGTFTFFEMARSFYEFRARTFLTNAAGCVLKGYLMGLDQPPRPQ